MTFAPVGLRCPDHAGVSHQTATRAVRSVQRPLARRGIVIRGAIVTRALVALNVIIYLVTVAQGGGINDPGGPLFDRWLLYGPFVANGDWWRLLTACFLHVGIWHIAVNMYALWWLGSVYRTMRRGEGVANHVADEGRDGRSGASDAPTAFRIGPPTSP